MRLDIYVNYRGKAFRFYEAHLGGRITSGGDGRRTPEGAPPSRRL